MGRTSPWMSNHARRRLQAGAAAALAWLMMSCGGNNSSGQSISGDVTTDKFEVPAGETMMVTGDLTVNASSSIAIAGDLIVDEGANLSLLSQGDLDVDGYVGVADGQARQADRQISPGGSVTYLFFGRNIRFRNRAGGARKIAVKGTKAADIFVATTIEGSVTVQQQVLGGDGLNSGLPGQPGQNGGAVEIGTDRAVNAVRAKVGTIAFSPPTVSLDLSRFETVEGALLLGGQGGDGFTDTIGQRDDGVREMIFTGTPGGVGGQVAIKTETFHVLAGNQKDFLQGGAGGVGGGVDQFSGSDSISGSNGPSTPAPDGTGSGEAGYGVRAMTGAGGAGGDARLAAATYDLNLAGEHLDSIIGRPGVGGPNGALVRISPGDGHDGGNGGYSIVLLGKAGANGLIFGPDNIVIRPPTADAPANIFIAGGGRGGESLRAGVPGGKAGYISVLDSDRLPVNGTLTLLNAHRGGDGFGACGLTPPGAGSNGGGFDTIPILSIAAVIGPDLMVNPDALSLLGGTGGDGTPPGTGGQPDVDDQARPFGKAGPDGAVCGDPGGGGNDGGGGGGSTVPGGTVTVH